MKPITTENLTGVVSTVRDGAERAPRGLRDESAENNRARPSGDDRGICRAGLLVSEAHGVGSEHGSDRLGTAEHDSQVPTAHRPGDLHRHRHDVDSGHPVPQQEHGDFGPLATRSHASTPSIESALAGSGPAADRGAAPDSIALTAAVINGDLRHVVSICGEPFQAHNSLKAALCAMVTAMAVAS